MEIKIKRATNNVKIPTYGSASAAAFDISVYSPEHLQEFIQSGNSAIFPTGLFFEVPEGFVLKVFSRSGHGFKSGVRLANCVGIIDSDYTGELMIKLINDGPDPFMVEHGDRIAQGIFEPVQRVSFVVAEEIKKTERGAKGLGSTGSK